MREEEITQGSIINGIRSEKYPNISCLGIVISARCDLANCKINKAYLITALNAEQWIKGVGLKLACEDLIKAKSIELEKWSKANNFQYEILETFSLEEIEVNIETVEDKKNCKIILDKWKDLYALKEIREQNTIDSKKPCYKLIKSKAKDKLKEIATERNTHLCYIPKDAYNPTNRKSEGLVVDLLDLCTIPIDVMEMLQRNEIDAMVLKQEIRLKLSELLFLENDDDFATVIGQIKSPIIEWLMQRFALSFIRIGIDRPTENDIESIINKTFEGDNNDEN